MMETINALKENTMLDFIKEKVSNQWAAHSKTVPFRIYFIEELAFSFLTISQGAEGGGIQVTRPDSFNTLDEAKLAAETLEGDT